MQELGKLAKAVLNLWKKVSRTLLSCVLPALLVFTLPAAEVWSQSTDTDSVTTPFRKGRWLSGLNGSFNSNTLKLESAEELYATNSYGIEIFTGKFVKDRWFIGLNVIAIGSNGSGLIERESESMIIGPSVSHYFLRESYGSLYVSVLPGYIRIREEGTIFTEDEFLKQSAEGPGFATRLRLGYSYVISDRIVLDVGVGNNFSWLKVSYNSEIEGVEREESIFSNGTFFSFGFNVLLDEFFF